MIDIGFHPGMSFEDYVAIPAVNSSALKYADRSMAKVKAAMDGLIGKETPSTRFGSLVHTLVLEPDEFDKRYIMDPGPGPDFLTAKGKEATNHRNTTAYEDWCKEHGLIVLTEDEKANADACASSVRNHERAMELMAGDEVQREVTIVWRDRGDVLCKARIDILGDNMADLKTTANVHEFERAIGNWDYDFQACFYRRGIRILTGEEKEFAVIAAESEAPFEVRAAPFSTLDIDAQEDRIDRGLQEVRRCQLSDTWPGAESPECWQVPDWKRKQIENAEAF